MGSFVADLFLLLVISSGHVYAGEEIRIQLEHIAHSVTTLYGSFKSVSLEGCEMII